jgi:hypothetical protein
MMKLVILWGKVVERKERDSMDEAEVGVDE